MRTLDNRKLDLWLALALVLPLQQSTSQAQPKPGGIVIGEDKLGYYEAAPTMVARYRELQNRYNFVDISEFRNEKPWDELDRISKANLKYFIDEVAPQLDDLEDALIVAWWVDIEGILSTNVPWGYSFCDKDSYDPSFDCEDRYWQVGYGIQVRDKRNLASLEETCHRFYVGSLPKDIGEKVLSKAGIRDLRFPEVAWATLTNPMRLNNVRSSGKSNHFWASILMRDPLISASLQARILREDFDCYQDSHNKWCEPFYTSRRREHSKRLVTILHAWGDIEKAERK